jgi:uncharacterized protein YjbI with pentapeptide repeats
LGWWAVPFTIALLWWRSLVARLAWLTAIQLFSLGIAVAASLFFVSIARATLRGVPITKFDNWRRWLLEAQFPRKFIWAVLVIAALSVFSVRVFQGAQFPLLSFDADLAYASLSPAETSTAGGGERRANSLRGRNLRGCRASHAELAYVDLSRANLSGCNFEGADLGNADLTNAILLDAVLDRANLRGATFAPRSETSLSDNADVQGSVIKPRTSSLSFAITTRANNWVLARWGVSNPAGGVFLILPNALLMQGLPRDHNERLTRKDLASYDFDHIFSHRMQHADLKGWILHNCIFTKVNLEDADLSHSDLRDARFDNAGLTNVNFDGADLRGADFSSAQGLTQWQLNSAITGKSGATGRRTVLPPGLHGHEDR